ncbi:hypothetical protein NDU88_003938 [Pleurodeles waltl]|uniref:Uncharacterized protein n=1 Tax=Pleurodeles waltl TaxID=8319 RepID=A0AAV7UDI7_PLEWA|nr:hypothetical protein NDU88_003938 [Pleurodeles waltl]
MRGGAAGAAGAAHRNQDTPSSPLSANSCNLVRDGTPPAPKQRGAHASHEGAARGRGWTRGVPVAPSPPFPSPSSLGNRQGLEDQAREAATTRPHSGEGDDH